MSDLVLALGGGGVKGVAHLGIIRRLEKDGFNIKAVAGTSAGGVVGAVYAAGVPMQEIVEKVARINAKDFFSRRPHDGPSVMGLAGLVDLLTPYLEGKTYKDLKIPFAVTSVDVVSSNEYIINRGSVLEGVLATVAIPGIFPPVEMEGAELVDGGVLDPVPVAVARWLMPKYPVVAVCLSPAPEKWAELPDITPPPDSPIPQPLFNQFSRLRIGQALRIFIKSMDITSRMTAELRMQVEKPEVIIRPEIHHIGYLDKVDPDELIEAGEKAAEAALPQIRHSLSWYHQLTRQFQSPHAPGIVLSDDGESGV